MLGTLFAAFVGVFGAVLGFIVSYLLRPRALRYALRFAAGVMLGVATFELMPEAFERGGLWRVLGGVMLGQWFCLGLQLLFERRTGQRGFYAAALCAAAGIAAHNLPEGLAIGAGCAASIVLGRRLALTILLHDIPEGAGVALPLRLSGKRAGTVFLWTVAAGLPTALGAMLARLFGAVPGDATLSVALAFAGGAMLWVTFGALLPASEEEPYGLWDAVACIGGLLAGFIASVPAGI